METYKCLIVDDERLAQELIENYIKKIPYLEVIAACSTAMEAMQQLAQNKVDIMFLDIQMPDITGIDFLRSLKNAPATIFTTAYSEYALDGYELGLVDYLLKPIEFDRFFKAVTKAVDGLPKQVDLPRIIKTPATIAKSKEDYFFIKSDSKIVRIAFDDILFIEALQKYIRIYTTDKKVMSLLSMSKIQEMLPAQQFARIHRSYMININRVDSIEGNMVKVLEHKLPISKGQRDRFMEIVRGRGPFL